MSLPGWTEWTADRVAVTVDKVVLDLRRDGKLVGRFTVYQGGRLEPNPPNEARDLLVRQATALRGELERSTFVWRDVDGWKVFEHNGHIAKVRREAANRFVATIDGQGWTCPVYPDDLSVLQRALEDVLREMPPKS